MVNPDLNSIPNNMEIHIVFDGKKFFTSLNKNIRKLLKRNPTYQLWESWSKSTPEINDYVQALNDNL